MQTRLNRESRTFGLDFLRASAIAFVVASHIYLPLTILGVWGVEMFFVLSGFLIGGILIRSVLRLERFDAPALTEFWIRRWFRTLPNYFWFLALFLCALKTSATPRQLWSFAFFMQNFAWSIFPFATHTWSLAIEEWFYLLFPAIFWAFSYGIRGRTKVLGRFIAVVGIFLTVPTLLRFGQPLWLGYSDPRMIVVSRLDAMMYGVIVAHVKATSTRWTRLQNLWPIGLAGVLLGTICLRIPLQVTQSLSFTLFPCSFGLILPAFDGWSTAAGRFPRVTENISKWSYSLYMCHMLVYEKAMQILAYPDRSTKERVFIKFAVVAVAIALSAVNYKAFEYPMTRLRDRLGKRGYAQNPVAKAETSTAA